MPEESYSRVVVVPDDIISPGQTVSKAALAAVDDEPLPENPQDVLAKIRTCPAYLDGKHKDHALALEQERRLCFGIVNAADKAEATTAAQPADLTDEQKHAAVENLDRQMIDKGAVALLGDDGVATIEADTNIANDPEALKLLAELGQMERDFPGASQDIRQHLHLTPDQAKRVIAEKQEDPTFLAAFHNNGNFRHNAAVGEMRCLHLIAEGGILKWQERQQQPQRQ